MYRSYYSYNDMPQPVYEKKHIESEHNNTETEAKKKEICKPAKKENERKKLPGNFETDDIILAGVVLLLLANDCDDKLLLIAIAFIFFSGFEF